MLLVAFAVFVTMNLWAQEIQGPYLLSGNSHFRKWSLGAHFGGLIPAVALGGKNDFSDWNMNFGYGAYVKYQATHVIGVQVDFLRGSLEGNNNKQWANADPSAPYSSFKTDLNWAASMSGLINLGNINWSYMHTDVQPYVTVGVGAVNYTSNIANTTENALYFPVGLGLKVNLSPNVNLDLGYSMSYVDADNLDGYYKAPYLGDKFSYTHIGVEFILGKKDKPQLARHNPVSHLYTEMKHDQEALKSLIAANQEKIQQKLDEIGTVKEQSDKLKMDKDGDGVSDYFDKCPGTPRGTKIDGAGCPINFPVKDTVIHNTYITNEDRRIVDEAINNLEFEFGKSTIRDISKPYLDKVAAMMVEKGFSLKLGGHTDNIGSEEANMKISKNRAEAIKNYLVAAGVNYGKIEAVGYGESQPIATNKTAVGRQKNRRVEFTLY